MFGDYSEVTCMTILTTINEHNLVEVRGQKKPKEMCLVKVAASGYVLNFLTFSHKQLI